MIVGRAGETLAPIPSLAGIAAAPRTDAPPIRFRGSDLRLDKGYYDGTHRAVAPGLTLERLRPVLDQAGITRIANITGLDRIGIPTTLAIRPGAKSLVGSAGKGLTIDAAQVSAAMEAFEIHYAELITTTAELYGPYRRLTDDCEVIPRHRLPYGRSALFSPDVPYHWILGWDLVGQVEVAVPLALVRLGHGALAAHEQGVFHATSNGLASGNHILEAIHSGVLEVIERDAVACHVHEWRRQGPAASPALVSDDSLRALPLVAQLVELFERASIGLAVADCTTDTEVPVYTAWIWDKTTRGRGICAGHGAHLDTEIGIIRALTEAAQSRAVLIAGSRDNIFAHEYRRAQLTDSTRTVSVMENAKRSVDVTLGRSFAQTSFESDTRRLLDSLRRAGLDQVVVVPVSDDAFFGAVVKVIVPGLEGPLLGNYVAGPRAARFASAG